MTERARLPARGRGARPRDTVTQKLRQNIPEWMDTLVDATAQSERG
jgi:hypothetical protein|nr:hypothetical protein JVH1_0496 [Rhodococcus sp. JVH1]